LRVNFPSEELGEREEDKEETTRKRQGKDKCSGEDLNRKEEEGKFLEEKRKKGRWKEKGSENDHNKEILSRPRVAWRREEIRGPDRGKIRQL
jgi:hypothetical protein